MLQTTEETELTMPSDFRWHSFLVSAGYLPDTDVRTPQEYQEGHIPESKNVPLQQLNNVVSVVKNTEIPLFVYCYSGARSRQATGMLQRMGYSKVNNIGGIAAYSGKVEK